MRTAILGLVVCGTVMAYAASLRGGYVYEDIPDRISRDRFIAWSGWAELQSLPERPARSLDRALMLLTQRFAGGNPFVARSINLAVHLLNGLLLWLLARQVLTAWGALFASALFLLHPVQTEAVAYVAGRPELLTATWVLLALLVSRRSVAFAGLCAVLAVTGKEMGVMALGLVPLWAWCTGHRWSRSAMVGWAGVSLIMGGFFVRGVQASIGSLWASGTYVAAQLTAYGRLLFLLPEAILHPSALTIDHDWIWITRPLAYASAALWAMALWALWRWPLWRYAVLGSLVAIAPRLLFPLLDGLHERYLMVPMIGWSLAFGSFYGRQEAASWPTR